MATKSTPSAADVDLQKSIVRGSRMIVGQGPLGNPSRADAFWLKPDHLRGLVVLNGNVHMTALLTPR